MSCSVCLSVCLFVYLSICLFVYLTDYQSINQTVRLSATCLSVNLSATCRSIPSILSAWVWKLFPPQIYAIPRDLPISRGEGCQSRVQIRPVCPRHPFISLPRVQIMGFCPRRMIHVCKSGPSAPSAFMDVVPNCGKSPLSTGCFAIRRVLCRCPAMN